MCLRRQDKADDCCRRAGEHAIARTTTWDHGADYRAGSSLESKGISHGFPRKASADTSRPVWPVADILAVVTRRSGSRPALALQSRPTHLGGAAIARQSASRLVRKSFGSSPTAGLAIRWFPPQRHGKLLLCAPLNQRRLGSPHRVSAGLRRLKAEFLVPLTPDREPCRAGGPRCAHHRPAGRCGRTRW